MLSNLFLYSSGRPKPYMADTLATTTTSSLVSNVKVASCLSLSISSSIAESFSMYESLVGR